MLYVNIKVIQSAFCPPILIPSPCSPLTERITASLSGEAEKQVTMATVPPARALACVHACQHRLQSFSSDPEVIN